MFYRSFCTALVAAALCLLPTKAEGVIAPDASEPGPFGTAVGEYRLPAELDPLVRESAVTEIWAKTHYPVDATGDLPLLLFLHGNHSTCGTGEDPRLDNNCEYTNTGTCPVDYVVVPSHEGYDYVAERLASHGYVVVSINANRGINCDFGDAGDTGLVKARARLVLRHLELLSQWNGGLASLPGGFDPKLEGRLDFAEVGLLGHSRGGEGVRAAYDFYLDRSTGWRDRILERVGIQAIFEIAAVDGQSDTEFNAPGVAWGQLLPLCDGDVSDMQGVQPFDRTIQILDEAPPRPKATYSVWGANHNFFNTEWQENESDGCLDHDALFPDHSGSEEQQAIGRAAIMALFRGAVGPRADRTFLQNFNPAYELPGVVADVTRVDRGFVDSPRQSVQPELEDFSAETGMNLYGFDNESAGVELEHTTVPNHSDVQFAADIEWEEASPDAYLEVHFADAGTGRGATRYRVLSFRTSRQIAQPSFTNETDYHVSMVMANGGESLRLPISDYTSLTGPVGEDGYGGRHPILQTVRIPLVDFVGLDPANVRGVRFSFDLQNPGETTDDGGAIHLSDIRLSVVDDTSRASPQRVLARETPVTGMLRRMGSVEEVVSVSASRLLGGQPAIEVTVKGDGRFPVTDSLPSLRVGSVVSWNGRYSNDTTRMTFAFPPRVFEDLAADRSVELTVGGRGHWHCGEIAPGRLGAE